MCDVMGGWRWEHMCDVMGGWRWEHMCDVMGGWSWGHPTHFIMMADLHSRLSSSCSGKALGKYAILSLESKG